MISLTNSRWGRYQEKIGRILFAVTKQKQRLEYKSLYNECHSPSLMSERSLITYISQYTDKTSWDPILITVPYFSTHPKITQSSHMLRLTFEGKTRKWIVFLLKKFLWPNLVCSVCGQGYLQMFQINDESSLRKPLNKCIILQKAAHTHCVNHICRYIFLTKKLPL